MVLHMNVLHQHIDIFIKEYFNEAQKLRCSKELPPHMFEHLARALELNTFLCVGCCFDVGIVKTQTPILKMEKAHSTSGSPTIFDSDSPLII